MKKRRDFRLLLVALLLLAVAFVAQLFFSRRDVERKEKTLAGVPEFPQRGASPKPRPLRVSHPEQPPLRAPPPPEPHRDRMLSFIQHRPDAALLHVNALFNTPLFERIQQCMPEQIRQLQKGGEQLGIDFTRDIDQIAFAGDGVAVSGFFDGKDLAGKVMHDVAPTDYGGVAIYDSGSSCMAQMGNLLVTGRSGTCPSMIDRASQPTLDQTQDDVYGDIFMHSTLAQLRADDAPPALQGLGKSLARVTLRANVWDSVALSVEGEPIAGKSADQLADLARGAASFAKGQLDDDQIELKALADLAKVSTSGGKLSVDLALPTDQLFDLLHFPCPGRDAGAP